MSVLLSISSVLSFLSFLTTVLALARVGAAAFATNQSHMQQQLQRLQLVAAGGDASNNGLLLPRGSQLALPGDDDNEKGVSDIEKLKGLVGAGDLMRMPANWGSIRRPRLAFPPAALLDEPQQPLSMAKLIMSRHSQRRPSRAPSPRRPPGLASSALPRSRLVEETAV